MSDLTRRRFLELGGVLAAGAGMTGWPAAARTADARGNPEADRGKGSARRPAAAVPESGRFVPDLVLLNGRVYTVDAARPEAQAFAVAGGRFLAVGSDDEIRDLVRPGTEVIDAGGMTVTPGFIDAHSHPFYAGVRHLKDVNVDLRSIARIQSALRERAASTPPGQWVLGFMYDDTKLEDGRPLSRADLDQAVPDHPVQVEHRGGHTAVYNSLAFRLAGVTARTPDPEGGKFYREDGELTGKVAERARAAFEKLIPSDTTREERARAMALISRLMTAAGLTSVQETGIGSDGLIAYQDAYASGDLRFRAYPFPSGGGPLGAGELYEGLKAAGIRTGFGDDRLRIGAVKFVVDGSASERTMAMSTPYVGRPDDFGILTMTQEQVNEVVEDAHRHGFQIGIHANGDRAIDIVLNAYERAQSRWPRPDPRFRIEHCSLVNPDLLRRIKAIGAIPTPFYTYIHYHGNKWGEYGPEKMRWMFAHRSFLDYGIPVAGASDYPPGPFEPLMAIQSLVTRRDMKGRVWGPNQRISVDEALRVCTLNGAHASFEEHLKGSITRGKLADFVILARDPHEEDPDRIKRIPVVRTVVGGETVHQA
ncbi:MAG: amidohydrolase [Gemmatimonadota bacterium]